MKTSKATSLLAAALVATLAASCAPIQPTATVTSGGGPGIAEAQAVPYNGPKARITVSKFTDRSAKGYGDIGEGMTDMLTTALFNTNRFIVLERGELGEVLREQDLASSGRIKRGTEAPTGEIEGAELLIVGAITEFEPNAGGVGGGVLTGVLGLGIGVKTAHIAIDVRIIDAKTSRILAAQSVEGKAQDIGGLGGLAVGGPLAIGFGAFAKTPMEKAIRVCLQTAVNFIANQTPAQYYH
ncbi:MAG TPA: CsgG/HfaB family protein [Candidatus Methanoperedens sp.]|nr:CsgG/HfaB family protein [Candidatus Methanoperedens sp.]